MTIATRFSIVRLLGLVAALSGCASETRLPAAPSNPSHETTLAEETVTVKPVALTVVPASEDEVICRRESITGSHQKREVCATRAERRADRREAQDWHRSGGLRGGVSSVPTVR